VVFFEPVFFFSVITLRQRRLVSGDNITFVRLSASNKILCIRSY